MTITAAPAIDESLDSWSAWMRAGAMTSNTVRARTTAVRRFAERIQRESTRLGHLVTELMELSRLQGAEPLPSPEQVSVDWVIADAVDRTRTNATAKNIDLVVVGTRGRGRGRRVDQHVLGEPGSPPSERPC